MPRVKGSYKGNRGFERASSSSDSIETMHDGIIITTKPSGRKCQYKGCNKIMSIYNVDDKYCFAHQREG